MEKVILQYVNPNNPDCGGMEIVVGQMYGLRGTVMSQKPCELCAYCGEVESIEQEEVIIPERLFNDHKHAEGARTFYEFGELKVRRERGK